MSGLTTKDQTMRRTSWIIVAIVAALAVVAALAYVGASRRHGADVPGVAVAGAGPGAAQSSGVLPRLSHVFVIVDENRSYRDIVGNAAAPYLNGLIARSALAADSYALFHPSLPNYIALTSGSNDGITDDRSPPSAGNEVSVVNIADRLEAAGRTWKEYAESIPSPGYAFDSGEYVTRHVPFAYYRDIIGDRRRAQAHIVPFTQMATDLRSAATTPDFAFITPNVQSDMHDSPTAVGDRWLSRVVPSILGSAAFRTTPSLLVVTFDEGTTNQHIVTIFAGNAARAGYRSPRRYDHYSLLHTIEADWGLAPLTANDAGATIMDDLFAR
jgi:phosphatidylinositol-3-phosphatase